MVGVGHGVEEESSKSISFGGQTAIYGRQSNLHPACLPSIGWLVSEDPRARLRLT